MAVALAAQTNVGEWSGDFARDMLLGWYSDGGLETPNTRYDESYVPVAGGLHLVLSLVALTHCLKGGWSQLFCLPWKAR